MMLRLEQPSSRGGSVDPATVLAPSVAEVIGSMLPPAVEAVVRRGVVAARRRLPRSIPLTWLRGTVYGSGTEARVLVAGDGTAVAYWVERFFAAPPRCERRGLVAQARLATTLDACRDEVDLTLAHLDVTAADHLDAKAWLSVPDWVGARVAVPSAVAALARCNGHVAGDRRRTRRGRFVAAVSHAPDDLRAFYRTMYLPHLEARLGTQAHVRSLRRLRRAFAHGGLLWVMRDGVRVGGHLFEEDGDTLHSVAVALAGGDAGLLKAGAGAALYVHFVAHAATAGFAMLDLRGTRASLHDGVLRYKRKWGAQLYLRDDVHQACFFHWPRTSPAIAALLARCSLIAQHAGLLYGIAGFDAAPTDAMAGQRTRAALSMPGLHDLCLIAPSGNAMIDASPPSRSRSAAGSAAVVAEMVAKACGPAMSARCER